MDIKRIEYAIESCFRVSKLGFDGLRAFILTDTSDLILDQWALDGETREEYNDRIACICASGQAYFRMWLQDPICSHKTRVNIDNLSEFKLNNGIYYIQFAGWESHYFVWIVCDQRIIYAGTDGMKHEVTVKEFIKDEYMERFHSAMKGNMDDYMYVFCFEIPTVPEVGFEWFEIEKSTKYK